MKPHISLIRAVGTEFIQRRARPFVIVLGVLMSVCSIGTVLLTRLSGWWWLLAAPVCFISAAVTIMILIAHSIIMKVRPYLTDNQSQNVAQLVDKLERVAETVQTPMPLILMKIVHDIVRPKQATYLNGLLSDGTTLHRDVIQLDKSFR